MSGLVAAREIADAGRSVVVLDKGRGVGGRMATRRIGEAVFDHGAQFLTARSERFLNAVADWSREGALAEWCRGFSQPGDGHSRWRGCPSMSGLPKHLAKGLDVRTAAEVASISLEGDLWAVALKSSEVLKSRSLIVTAPVPQARKLLEAVPLRPEDSKVLDSILYERCLAVMAILDSPTALPPPGALQLTDPAISWICDNQQKGISPIPCVTIHATDAFSRLHWEGDRAAAGAKLFDIAQPWIGTPAREMQVHGWRYSKPIAPLAKLCAILRNTPPLVLAGDAFGGAKVEGAVLSGWAAAEEILRAQAIPSQPA